MIMSVVSGFHGLLLYASQSLVLTWLVPVLAVIHYAQTTWSHAVLRFQTLLSQTPSRLAPVKAGGPADEGVAGGISGTQEAFCGQHARTSGEHRLPRLVLPRL